MARSMARRAHCGTSRFDEFEREWGRALAERVGETVGERLKATLELRPWFPG